VTLPVLLNAVLDLALIKTSRLARGSARGLSSEGVLDLARLEDCFKLADCLWQEDRLGLQGVQYLGVSV
jgi:hypothetical protein